MSLKEHGIEKFGRLIDQNIAQARYLGGLIEAEPRLQLLMPPSINIVCYRFRPDGMEGDALKALNVEIMLRLQEDGSAVISDTTVAGEHFLRVAINNHRTRKDDQIGEHTSELQSLMRISYAVFCLKKKTQT